MKSIHPRSSLNLAFVTAAFGPENSGPFYAWSGPESVTQAYHNLSRPCVEFPPVQI